MALVDGQAFGANHQLNQRDTSKDPSSSNYMTRLNLRTMRSRQKRRLIDYLSARKRGLHDPSDDLSSLAKNHSPFLYRMNLMKKMPVHDGCVNTICWNKTGEYILSGSDDRNLCITKPTCIFDESNNYSVLHKVQTHHIGNILSAKFLPNSMDNLLVSGSSQGPVIAHDICSSNPSLGILNFNCHSSSIFEVATISDDDKVFLSCSQDKTVRLFDMRCHKSCHRAGTCPHPALIRNSHAATTLAIHPLNSNLLLVGRADGLGLIYDRRKLPDVSKFSREQAHLDYLAGNTTSSFKYLHPLDGVVSQFSVPDMETKCRFTSLCFSPRGDQVLASYSQDYVYLFELDRSSSTRLIQTLPKNPSATDNAGSNDNNNSENSTSESHNQTGAAAASAGRRVNTSNNPRVIRTPRLRVRGDWSDTGIDSVPMSASSSIDREARNFLQRMADVAFSLSTQRSSGSSRFIPMSEIIAGPLQYRDSNSTSGVNRNNLDEDDDNDEEEEDDDDEEEVEEDDGEEPEEDRDNGEENPNDEDDENDSNVDDDSDDYGDTYAMSIECEDVGHDATNPVVSHRLDPDEREEEDEPVTTTRGMNEARGSRKSKAARSRISSLAKSKFRKTLADLKNKYKDIPAYQPRVRYQGHRNSRTSIMKAVFWGDDYIMSGSDCGRIMIWEKETANLVMGFPADNRVVNCLAPNPHHYALASSGIDYDIKLWSTQSVLQGPLRISRDDMGAIVRNNELMLEEARQTITVPPHLFFRVLASFAQNRLS